MPFPAAYAERYCYHFTDVRNIPSILEHGLLCTNIKNKKKIEHVDIASESIQGRRSAMAVTCGVGGVVHDYVPFYFASTNPMFLSISLSKNNDQQFFVFLAIKVSTLIGNGAVFTDEAANGNTAPEFYNDPNDLSKLDWALIDKRGWKSSEKEAQKRMAEVLVPGKVDIALVDTIIVWNDSFKNELLKQFKQYKIQPPHIELTSFKGRYFYFTKFGIGEPLHSIITGPFFLKKHYKEAIANIKKQRAKRTTGNYLFGNIADALKKIDLQFNLIPEMDGIFEMETDNFYHTDNVSDHTKQVVAKLSESNFYNSTSQGNRDIMKLAAYLHDIGKGPKTRWKNEIQPRYDDHPADGPKMMERILVEDFDELSDYAIEKLCLLITYHDLIGEIIGKHRDRRQIKDIVKEINDFKMLRALNYADVKSLNGYWAAQFNLGVKDLFEEVKQYLESND